MLKLRLSSSQRQNVRETLRCHPRILSQVANLSEIVRLTKTELVNVSAALGINFEAAKNGTYLGAVERGETEWAKLPFDGAFELDVDLVIAGSTERRILIIDYEFAPDWPYLDIKSGEERHVCEEFVLAYFLTGHERRTKGAASPELRPVPRRGTYRNAINITEQFCNLFDDDLIISIKNAIEEECLRKNESAVDKMTRRATDLTL